MARTKYTLDELRIKSLALRNLLEQQVLVRGEEPPDQARIDAITGDTSGPAAYDLTAIWRASLEDPDCLHISQGRGKTSPQARRYMSPRRYVNSWPHMIEAIEEPGDGRILVDRRAAFDYCQKADCRVMQALIDNHIAARKSAAQADPIGNAVDSAKGGGFAMMFARADALHLGLSDQEFNAAVLERAKEDARFMDDYAAEEHVSMVRKAIEGDPGIKLIHLDTKD